MTERYWHTITTHARESVNRRFPLTIVKVYARSHDSEESQHVDHLTRRQREKQAKRFVQSSNPYITARFLQLAGLPRRITREVMAQCLSTYLDYHFQQVVEQTRQAVQQTSTDNQTYIDTLSGQDMMVTMRHIFQIMNHIESLDEPTAFQKLLDSIF